MNMPNAPFVSILAVCLTLAMPVAVVATDDDAADMSPENVMDGLELRSVISFDGVPHYSLHHPDLGTAVWVAAGESFHGLEIGEFHADANHLVLHYGDDGAFELRLATATIAELEAEGGNDGGERRSRAERRREAQRQLREFAGNWRELAGNSPELQAFEAEARELVNDFREVRRARQRADRDSEERAELLRQERALWREVRLSSEYGALQVSGDERFANSDPAQTERLLRRMMFTRSWRNASSN